MPLPTLYQVSVRCIILYMSSCQDLVKVLLTPYKRSLHDVLNRRSCGDPGEIQAGKSLREDLAGAMYSMRGACMKMYERFCARLLRGSCIPIL